jgi:hypothetical protein
MMLPQHLAPAAYSTVRAGLAALTVFLGTAELIVIVIGQRQHNWQQQRVNSATTPHSMLSTILYGIGIGSKCSTKKNRQRHHFLAAAALSAEDKLAVLILAAEINY